MLPQMIGRMSGSRPARLVRWGLRWCLPVVLLGLAPFCAGPLLVRARYPLLLACCVCAALALPAALRQLRRAEGRWLRCGRALLLLLAAALALGQELNFWHTRHRVLQTDPARLQRLGRHLMAGYHVRAEIEPLVERGAVGGIFITARNLRGRSLGQVRAELHGLQQARRRRGLSELLVAADQEGGEVSRLSPPLTPLPPLRALLQGNVRGAELTARVRRYAAVHGRELQAMGVNVNFSPVVDLRLASTTRGVDLYSSIADRAISHDPARVTEVALAYSETLWQHGVASTLKHFPGLGRVAVDTHLFAGRLDLPTARLEQQDWLPFRRITHQQPSLIMLAHVKLAQQDPRHLVSGSRQVVQGLIRRRWGHQGLLITDDFCMRPAWYAAGGLRRSLGRSLNAGVDIVLVSSDTRQIYVVLAALLEADTRGELDAEMLARSTIRLRAFRH